MIPQNQAQNAIAVCALWHIFVTGMSLHPSVTHAQSVTDAAREASSLDQGMRARANAPGLSAQKARLLLSAEVFSGLNYVNTQAEDFNSFELTRGEAGLDLRWENYGGELRMEAVRSAGPQSLLGVDGDSLLMRVKRAWGFGRFDLKFMAVEVRGGLINDSWIDSVQFIYDLRGATATLGERGLFYDTSDLGGEALLDVMDGLVRVRVSATNGEGRNQREQNSGKNTTAVLVVRPLQFKWRGDLTSLNLLASYRDGSAGAASARNHRLAGALIMASSSMGAGFEIIRAQGYLGRAELEAQGLGAWANVSILRPYLGVMARFDQLAPDTNDRDNFQRMLTLGLYSDLGQGSLNPFDPRLRLYLLFQDEKVGDTAGPLPGVPDAADLTRAQLILEWRGATER